MTSHREAALLIAISIVISAATVSCRPRKPERLGRAVQTGNKFAALHHVKAEIATDLVETFAPIIYYDRDDKGLPSTVDWALSKTSWWVREPSCQLCLEKGAESSEPTACNYTGYQLGAGSLGWKLPNDAPCGKNMDSEEDRDASRSRTFYIADVPERFRRGPEDTSFWATYVHVYDSDVPGAANGTTIQYWRFYPYNFGKNAAGIGFDHGGDWEGIHVVLDGSNHPVRVRLLGHQHIEEFKWSDIKRQGDHPKVHASSIGHASERDIDADESKYIRHESWNGGQVSWPGRSPSQSGGLQYLGTRTEPQWLFLRYAGMWGSPGSGLIPSPGYWGPAFNDTDAGPDGRDLSSLHIDAGHEYYVKAWCWGIAGPTRDECVARK